MIVKEELKRLSDLEMVSGSEYINIEKLKPIFSKYCDDIYLDKANNMIFKKNGQSKDILKIMIAAHIDEIGLMVKSIADNGFIKFVNMGGIDARILLSQEVYIHGKKKIYGVIGSKPPHILTNDEKNKAIKMEDLAIDTGLSYKDVKKIVNVGDFITFKSNFSELAGDVVSGKSLDNRAGIAVMLECLKELYNVNIHCELYCTATLQEEVGLRGAKTSAYNISPDIAIAVDVCHGETPDSANKDTFKLKEGPVITLGPNIHPVLVNKLKKIADDYFISYQTDVEAGPTGTDAWAIQVIKGGIPTLLISLPLKYMHTTVEAININDLNKAGKLLAFFIKNIDNSWREQFVD